MKIIEALKAGKELQRKADDLKSKVAQYCVHLSNEQPVYKEQAEQVKQWIQAYQDIIKEILRLRIAIQKTNLATDVSIIIDGKTVTKSIAEWIHRRRDLAVMEASIFNGLTDRGLREGQLKQSTGEIVNVTIVRYYDPATRDKMKEIYTSEPSLIDARLEITNATTDIIE
jgi:hypothetical protein